MTLTIDPGPMTTAAGARLPVVRPKVVADAIVAALADGREDVFVPRELGPVARLIAGTPPVVADRIKRVMKVDSVMTGADTSARAGYNTRPGGQ